MSIPVELFGQVRCAKDASNPPLSLSPQDEVKHLWWWLTIKFTVLTVSSCFHWIFRRRWLCRTRHCIAALLGNACVVV